MSLVKPLILFYLEKDYVPRASIYLFIWKLAVKRDPYFFISKNKNAIKTILGERLNSAFAYGRKPLTIVRKSSILDLRFYVYSNYD